MTYIQARKFSDTFFNFDEDSIDKEERETNELLVDED